MNNRSIQDLLCFIEQPSRYLGNEINSIKKNPENMDLHICFAFPDLYEIGTSHFGIQILYHMLNSIENIFAERVFAPALDMADKLSEAKLPLSSLETETPLCNFDILGFSLLYELNYTNILYMLDLSDIPFLSSSRNENHPLIIAGGPCTCNPEPVADFFDAFLIGDGEVAVKKIAEVYITWKKEKKSNRKELLKKLSLIEGVYIPSFFTPKYDQSNFQILEPVYDNYTKVKRTIVLDLDGAFFPISPVIPYAKPVHDRLRIEVSRGCSRGCRFCQAGMIYRPVREKSPGKLNQIIEKSFDKTGYEDISLLSLSTGDYTCIAPFMEDLMHKYAPSHIAVSLPSLRAGSLTPKLMSIIKKVRKTGFTIAPEAGSQRLRDIINKNITEDEIISTVKSAFELGWQVIKLYFMIGLPGETHDDIVAITDLVKKLWNTDIVKKKKGKINVSITTFIPKPHVPFQWSPQISLKESEEKIIFLKKNIRLPGINFKWQDPKVSQVEGLWARGDRRLSDVLVSAYKKGCRFDGWSDTFSYKAWESAFEKLDPGIDFYTTRIRNTSEPLAWDHIDALVSKEFLKNELKKAACGTLSKDCRQDQCQMCGVCDFSKIKPVFAEIHEPENRSKKLTEKCESPTYKTMKINYSKIGKAKHFGHLELVKIFLRALRRLKISIKYSSGFHPKPKIRFSDTLPIGIESNCESFYITTPVSEKEESIFPAINNHLPHGLCVNSCKTEKNQKGSVSKKAVSYQITLEQGSFDKALLTTYDNSSDFFYTKVNKKGKLKKNDLKVIVESLQIISPDKLLIILKTESEKTVRPDVILKHVFQKTKLQIQKATIIKCIQN